MQKKPNILQYDQKCHKLHTEVQKPFKNRVQKPKISTSVNNLCISADEDHADIQMKHL